MSEPPAPTAAAVLALEALPAPAVQLTLRSGEVTGFYSTHQLALAFGTPELHWRRIVRDPESGLGGQKIGVQYFVSADNVKAWIEAGNFRYHPRPGRRVRPAAVDEAEAAARELRRRASQAAGG